MISVALTTYNGAKYIIEQLDSIKNQTLKADEVIICDDCSSDDTTAIIEKYIICNQLENWKLIKNSVNLGYTKNFYKAIARCSGDLIFLCDQDDIWYPEKIKEMTEVMKKNPHMMSLASSYDLCDGDGKLIDNPGVPNVRSKNDGTLDEFTLQQFMGASFIRGCTMCFRKEILNGEKLFNLSSLLGHDWLINVYACLKGENCCLNKKLSMYRVHQNNISFKIAGKTELKSNKQKRIEGLREELQALRYLREKSNIEDKERQIIKKEMRFSKKRLEVLEKKNILLWLTMIFDLGAYKRIYGNFKGAIKVYAGDLLYSRK